jgi:hypothetical protein
MGRLLLDTVQASRNGTIKSFRLNFINILFADAKPAHVGICVSQFEQGIPAGVKFYHRFKAAQLAADPRMIRTTLGVAGLVFITLPSICQSVQSDFVASVSETDRIGFVRTSVPLSDWHENTFWPQYADYRENTADLSLKEYIAVQDLARESENTSTAAYQSGNTLIERCTDELAMKSRYYAEIGQTHNGIIALKFLQTELLLDLMETSRIYDQSWIRKYRFNSNHVSEDSRWQAEYNTVIKALSLTPADVQLFLPIYIDFEREREETIGDQYDLYGLFVGEPTDFTPGLAKRQGYDLLSVMDRD